MLQSLSTLLFNEYRRRVLGLLLLQPELNCHVREIARQTGTSAGTLHKELSRLAQAGILRRTVQGKQVYYGADRDCPIFEELASILRKTSGVADVLAQALAPVADKVRAAAIFGSVAKGTERAGSDVDVLVIGDVGFVEVVRLLHPAQTALGREVNPKIYSSAEWQSKLLVGDTFARDVLAKPKIFLIGNEHDLREPVG
ncbi:DNA polymerase subunit beta [Trinickia dabaoshanensis]|uniref:DNA polymerase subunit beta n=1 Tax=Trinickia dabaoshanensis TaxID=564714 RepID=A0A2N7VZH8_9BURK|nr:nucleotidyltransferase domain-containing protein [Trinickia dabaoshanensis]PMS22551.1 DNA polymerase subunit beta [Trinickia dabaoshanensis]